MRSERKLRLAVASLVICAGVGCTLGPTYERAESDLPERFRDATVSGETIANLPWWDVFKDPALQQLVRIALAENKNLKIAVARIDASRALLGISRADQFPQLSGSGDAQRTEPSSQVPQISSQPFNTFDVYGDLSFEVDLWGRLRRSTEAQRAELLASEYGQRAVIIALISQVSTTYLTIRGLDDRLRMSRETFKNRKDATSLITARFDKGIVPELDVNQAQIEEAEAAAAAAGFERQIAQAENALSVLLGRTPFSIERGLPLAKQDLAQAIPTGFPAALLERRPDVLAAEERVKAAVARVGVAMAERLPTLNLLGFVGLQSSDASDLFNADAFTWGVGGNLLGPIIDWGKGASRVDFAKALAEANLQSYQDTVLTAVREVEDALVAIRTYRDERQQRLRQVVAARNAARLSWARYNEGMTSYLEVLDIERSLFDAELNESQALENQNASIVQLYKALGGGWEKLS